MRALHKSGVVTSTVNVGFKPRIMGAVGMTLGTLLLGFRLAPVSGRSKQHLHHTLGSYLD